MRLKEVKDRIIEILIPQNPLDKFLVWRTKDIAKILGYNEPSWTHHVLKILEIEGKVEDVSRTRNCLWQLKEDYVFSLEVKN